MAKLIPMLFIFVSLQSCVVESVIYYWNDTTPSSAVLLRPNPDGLEHNSVHLYLCRFKEVFSDGERFITGKLYLGSNYTRCMAGSHGAELVSTDFQMLIAPLGTTSWIPSNGIVPQNAVISGTTRLGQSGCPCRAPYDNSLLVGGTHTGSTCYASYGGREVFLTDNIELLVVNDYGAKLEEICI